MAFRHRVNINYITDAGTVSATTNDFTTDGEDNAEVAVLNDDGPHAVNVDFAIADVKSLLLVSDLAVTIYANNHGLARPVTGITRTGGTATAVVPNHGFATGNTVTVAGANQSDYNVAATVTVVDADTFTYTVANAPATPATGTTITATGPATTGTPIALLASTPVVWTETNIEDIPFSADVTKLFINNTGSASATVKVRVLKDVTP